MRRNESIRTSNEDGWSSGRPFHRRVAHDHDEREQFPSRLTWVSVGRPARTSALESPCWWSGPDALATSLKFARPAQTASRAPGLARHASYVVLVERVRRPVDSGTAKWVYRHISQSCCPFNIKFAQELKEPAFATRELIADKDARTLARALLAMSQAEFSAAFKGSAMKRGKRRGLARNAAVDLGNVGTVDDLPALEAALEHDEPLVRQHAAWALDRLGLRTGA